MSLEAPLRVRPVRREDLDAIMRIEVAAHPVPWSRDLMAQELEHPWATVFLCEREEEGRAQVQGYIVFWMIHDEIHILNVATDPLRRRQGVGVLLMQAAEALGREKGALVSTLEVRRSNAPAIGLYQGLGYAQVGVRPRYYSDNGEDALVMEKRLASEGRS